jgi:RHS repeat-associated protein
VGTAQAGLGYTGEYWDADVGLEYLRARWYDGIVGRFTRRDVWEGNYLQPQTLNGWNYVEGNPVNFTDPSGHCISGSDCERFVAEVQRFIDEAQAQTLLFGEQLSDDWVVHMLAGYYSGYRMTGELLGCTMAIPPGWISRGNTPERYWPRDDSIWRIHSESPDERVRAEAAALNYGFKRIFYINTHHYFANFHMAWFYGSFSASASNNPREQYQYFIQGVDYYETAADILIVDVAIKHVKQIRTTPGTGIEMLPQLLREDACGDSIEKIYEEWVWPNPYIESWLGPPPL